MMGPNYKSPHFRAGSYSERCARLIRPTQQWQRAVHEQAQPGWWTRAVTWAHMPESFLLEQSAMEVPGVMGRRHLEHRMFMVSMLNIMRQYDNKWERQQWYIQHTEGKPEDIVYLESTIGNLTKAEEAEQAKNMDFIFKNQLHAPNRDDMRKLGSILEIARLDGTNPMIRR